MDRAGTRPGRRDSSGEASGTRFAGGGPEEREEVLSSSPGVVDVARDRGAGARDPARGGPGESQG